MSNDFPLKTAIDRAWTVHIATHNDINAASVAVARKVPSGEMGTLVKATPKN